MIYTVTFNPALDCTLSLEKLTPGELNRAKKQEIRAGGKGINVSVVLHNLGLPTKALGFIAGFTGEAVLQSLLAQGVDTDFIRLEQGLTRINMKLKTDIETEINADGPVIPAPDIARLISKLETPGDGDMLVLAGNIPSSLPADIYETIMARLARKAVPAVVDAAGDLLSGVLHYRPFLIKPNIVELGGLCGRGLTTEADILAGAKSLRERGARNVLVSMGGKGALLLAENGECLTAAPPEGLARNTVGAGDSMVAGFLAGYLVYRENTHALRYGTAAGSATAFSGNLARKADVESLLQEIKITPLY